MGKRLDKRTLTMVDDREDINEKGKKFKGKFNGKKGSKQWKGKKYNDPVWHTKNSQIVKDLCSIPFNFIQGFPLRMGGTKKFFKLAFVTIPYDWFAGLSADFRSMLNNAATNIWEFIRSRNSGATNYQSADIFTSLILCGLDIVDTIQYAARAFSSLNLYIPTNRLSPRIVIEGMGFDFNDLNSNIANYRGRLNLLIAKASSIVLPKQFPIFDWIASLSSSIFKDRDTSNGREEYFMFTKRHFKIYDPKADSNGGMVRYVTKADIFPTSTVNKPAVVTMPCKASQQKMKMSVFLDILETQINAIITDEDANIIMGDLIKAYGSEAKFWAVRPISENDTQVPVYSEEALAQLHNATFIPSDPSNNMTTANDGPRMLWILGTDAEGTYPVSNVKQDGNGYLITDWWYPGREISIIHGTSPDSIVYHLLDADDLSPTPEEVLIATRFNNYYYSEKKSTYNGWRVATSSAVHLFEPELWFANNTEITSRSWKQDVPIAAGDVSVALASHFNKFAFKYDNTASSIVGDINNPVSIDNVTKGRMDDVDFSSLYDIPFTGKF